MEVSSNKHKNNISAKTQMLSIMRIVLSNVIFTIQMIVPSISSSKKWLEYHSDLGTSLPSFKFHSIRPLDKANRHIKDNSLYSFRSWVNINHKDCFIYGSFNFAVANRRKTVNGTPKHAWDALIN